MSELEKKLQRELNAATLALLSARVALLDGKPAVAKAAIHRLSRICVAAHLVASQVEKKLPAEQK